MYLYVGANPLMLVDPDGLGWKETGAGVFVWVTGGNSCVGRKIDTWGKGVRKRQTARRQCFRAGIMCGGMRVPKAIQLPGQAWSSSVWTKVSWISTKAGKFIGRAFIPVTLVEGGLALYDLVDSYSDD